MIPETLRNLECWFLWRWAKQDDGTPFKLPVQPNGKAAKSTGRETWHSYDKATGALERASGVFEGLAIGIGRFEEFGVWAIDLDGAIADDGSIKPWASDILDRVQSYTEYSPRGKGLHILVRGDQEMVPALKVNLSETEHCELYAHSRYMTFTGKHLPGTPTDLEDKTEAYKALRADLEASHPSLARSRAARSGSEGSRTGKAAARAAERENALTDEQVVKLAQSGPSGAAFTRLWEGDLSDYKDDHSQADMAFAGRLAFWTGKDPEQMDSLFRQSGLMRPKWDTRRGLSTYGEQTIEIAIDNCDEVYSGGDKSSETFLDNLKRRRAAKVAQTQVVGSTVETGHVADHYRGADKPAHGKKVEVTAAKAPDSGVKRSPLSGTNDWEHPNTGPIKRSPLTGRLIGDQSEATVTGPGGRGLIPFVPPGTVQDDLFDSRPLGVREFDPIAMRKERRQVNGNQSAIFTGPVNMPETGNIEAGDVAHIEAHPQEAAPSPPSLSAIADSSDSGQDQLSEEAPERTADSMLADQELLALNDAVLTREPRLRPHRSDPAEHPEMSDVGNGERFVVRYHDILIWSKSRGWLAFDHKRWASGEEFAQRAAEDTAKAIRGEATDPELTPEQGKKLIAHSVNTQQSPKIGALLTRAGWQPEIYVEESALDSQAYLLNVQNGTLNLITGELQAHNPADHITKITAAAYDPDAHSELWNRFLEEATRGQDGLAEFLQRAAGYTLTADTREDKVFVLHGVGGTGKSTFVGALRAMMGDYAMTIRAEALTEKGGGGHNEDIAVLAGARMVLAVEADDSSKMREGLMKTLSGGDPMSASRKNRPVFQFYPQLKLWLATNSMPRIRSDDSGSWRRVLKASFVHVPPAIDTGLRAKLRRGEHQRAILAWAVRGAQAWARDAERGVPLRVPESVRDATEQMRRSMDGQAEFFAEYLSFGGDKTWTFFADIMRAYNDFTEEAGIPLRYRLGQVAMNRALQNHGAEPDRRTSAGKQARGFWHITLVEENRL